RDLRDARIPGIAVAYVSDGRIAYTHGFGLASAETDTPVSPSTDSSFAASNRPSERDSQSDLHVTRRTSGVDLAEVRVGDRQLRIAEIRVVERVEQVRLDLHLGLAVHLEALAER